MSKLNTWLLRVNVIVWGIVMLLFLKGCTQMDTSSTEVRGWLVEFTSRPDGTCEATVAVNREDNISDDSVIVKKGIE